MKKDIMLTLDVEPTKVVREYLKRNGQSLSGWVNLLVTECANEIQGLPARLRKPVQDLTLGELGQVLQYWSKAMGVKDGKRKKA